MRTLCGDLARRGDPFEFLRNLLSHCTFSDDRDYRDDLFAGDEGAGIDGLILDDGRQTLDVGRESYSQAEVWESAPKSIASLL